MGLAAYRLACQSLRRFAHAHTMKAAEGCDYFFLYMFNTFLSHLRSSAWPTLLLALDCLALGLRDHFSAIPIRARRHPDLASLKFSDVMHSIYCMRVRYVDTMQRQDRVMCRGCRLAGWA